MSYLLEVPVGSKATVTAPPHTKPKPAHVDDGLIELVEQLEAINENKAAAKLNEVSMADSKGHRIYY